MLKKRFIKMSVVLVLGMYPVYSIFPYSYRRLLRRVHPHLSKVVVDTEREKEAKKTIVHAFRRMQLYNLLNLKSSPILTQITRSYRVCDVIRSIVVYKKHISHLEIMFGRTTYFQKKIDGDVELIRINMNMFPICCSRFHSLHIFINDYACKNTLLVGDIINTNELSKLRKMKSIIPKTITVDAFYSGSSTPVRLGEVQPMILKDNFVHPFYLRPSVKEATTI